MRLSLVMAGVAFVAFALGGDAAASPAWPSAKFVTENRRQCPRINLADLTDGTMTVEVENAASRLSPQRSRILGRRISARCAGELGGWYCENAVTIRSFDRWGLTPSFVAHLCRRYRSCPEPAAC
jgi:hypothetical protein